MQRLSTPRNDHAPGERGTNGAERVQVTETKCPNDERIAAIERQLAEFGQRLDEIPTSVNEVPSTEIVSRETVDEDRLEFIVKRVNAIDSRLTALESRPYVSEETLKQLDDGLNAKIKHMVEKHANGALGDIRSRLITVEKNSTSVTTTNGEPQSVQLEKLGQSIHSFGKYVSQIENDLEGRVAAVEQLCAEVSEHITETNLSHMKLSTRLYRALQALEHDEAAA